MIKRILVVLVSLLLSYNVFSYPLSNSIDGIINKVDPNINMGMVVVDLNTGETLYSRNENKKFTPASNMKLFSEAAALILFGPSYSFKTTLSTDAKSLNNGVLTGSIYLYLSGDPSLTAKDLQELFAELTKWNIKEIKGNVVIVSSSSHIKPHAPGVNPKDFTHSYGAPITPLILDENRVLITVNSSKIGKNALVEYDTLDGSFVLDNKIKTVTRGRCGVNARVTKDNRLKLRGCIYKNSQAIQLEIPITSPFLYAKRVIKNNLVNMGIKLDGDIVIGDINKPSMLLAKHISKPISVLMSNALKKSDNLYADSIFLHTAASLHGSPLTWQNAEPIVKNFLQKQTGINMQDAVMIDGSGLSLYDLVTPKQTVGLLQYIHSHFSLSYEYITSLAIAGQDGTLTRRFRNPSQRGFLRAKTGSLTGVSSLSGYLYTTNGHTLVFSIFINTRPGTSPKVSGQYLRMVDNICNFLLQQKPGGMIANSPRNQNTFVAYQKNLSKADKASSIYAKWRGIERSIKGNLKSDAVIVLFRNNKIIIIDNNKNPNDVWSALQFVRKKYDFSVGVRAKNVPSLDQETILLWQDKNVRDNTRTWYLQEVIG